MKYIIDKLKDKKGSGLYLIPLIIIFLIIIFAVYTNEIEHLIYIENKNRMEQAIQSACKAGVLQINKKDSSDFNNTFLDFVLDAERETGWKNKMQIDKNRSNRIIEKLIVDNFGVGYSLHGTNIYPNGTIKDLRKHLVLRAYSEPQMNGDIIISIFSNKDYGHEVKPQKIKIKKDSEENMKNQIEKEINNFLNSNSINGKSNKINILNTKDKPIPELSIYKPCLILFLQEYPIKTFTKQKYLNVFYLSPANIERKIK